MSTSKEEFFDLCTKVDWNYVYSDDYKVYSINSQKVSVIEKLVEQDKTLLSVYEAWKHYPLSHKKPDLKDYE